MFTDTIDFKSVAVQQMEILRIPPISTDAGSLVVRLLGDMATKGTSSVLPDVGKPISFQLERSYSDQWRFVQAMPVTLDYDSESENYMISDEIFVEYGTGETLEEAKEDYAENLWNYYLFLRDRADGDPETNHAFQKIGEYLAPMLG